MTTPSFFAVSENGGKDNSGKYIYLKNEIGRDKLDKNGHLIVDHDLHDHDGELPRWDCRNFCWMGQERKIEFLELEVSTSENISLWKKKSEIDYIPLFMSLWLSFNAWTKDRFNAQKDRDLINLCKLGGHPLSDKFSELMDADNASGNRFRGNLAELHRSLANANISPESWNNGCISFKNVIIERNDDSPTFVSLLKEENQQNKIKIDTDLYVDNDTEKLFSGYIEITYQIRCFLFHGNLSPKPENERVIKQLYLTLSMMMEKI